MNDPELAPLAEEIPAPRRTDAAFARAVADDVRRRKARTWVFAPVLAAAVGGLALLVTQMPPAATMADAGTAITFDDDDPVFALPTLEGSTDEELEQLERALDKALERKTP
jgi:hypothetical protein